MRIPLFHLNAFASQLSRGNPAAVCLSDFGLDDRLLQKVATENNLSATAFVVPANDGYNLRWFSPRCEIHLCGDATLAAAFVVLKLLKPGLDAARFCTRFRGDLTVRMDGDLLFMDLPARMPKTSAPVPMVLQALRLPAQSPELVEFLQANDAYILVLRSPNGGTGRSPGLCFARKVAPFGGTDHRPSR